MANLDTIYQSLTKLYCLSQISFFNEHALSPLHAFFDVTYRCNLRCNMCHSLSLIEDVENRDDSRKEVTSEQIKNMIRKLPRKTLITFTGGEPFLRKDITDILSSACKDYKCHVITNGTLINQEIAEFLVELRARSIMSSGLMMVGFSIIGPEDIHDEAVGKKGSFQKTISAIKLIQKMKKQTHSRYPMIHLTSVITRKNVSYLSLIYSLAKDLKLDYCNFVLENTSQFSRSQYYNDYTALYHSPPPAAKIEPELLNSQLNALEDIVCNGSYPEIRFSPNKINRKEMNKHFLTGLNHKDYRCYAPWSKIGFSAFGDVLCCPHVRVGNMIENNYDTLWNSKPYKRFREKLQSEKSFPLCAGCCCSEYVGK